MDASGLFQALKNNPIALAVSIGLHLMLFVLLAVSLSNNEPPQQKISTQQTVKAYVVDAKIVEQEINKLKQAEINKQQKIKKQSDKLNQQIEKEKKRLQKIKNKRKKLERQAKAKKIAEEKKAQLRKKAEIQRKKIEKKQLAENKKKAEIARKKEEERKKQEIENKAEAERLALIKKQKDAVIAEKKRLVEEKEMKRRLAEEERRQAIHNEKLKSLRLQYVRLIEQKVERNWQRPVTVNSDYKCEVFVTQSVLGDVIKVRLGACASEIVFRNSIERAVRKSSPLPPPPNPEVFDREIRFVFKPSN